MSDDTKPPSHLHSCNSQILHAGTEDAGERLCQVGDLERNRPPPKHSRQVKDREAQPELLHSAEPPEPAEGNETSSAPAVQDSPSVIAAGGAAAIWAWEGFASDEYFGPGTRQLYRTIGKRFLYWLEARGGSLVDVLPPVLDQFLDTCQVASKTKTMYRRALVLLSDALVTHKAVPVNSADQFARLTPVERQATVDAATFALAMQAIYDFTDGIGGQKANVERCEEVLRLGEQNGVLPLLWMDDTERSPFP